LETLADNGLGIEPIDPDHPAIADLRGRYFAHFGLRDKSLSTGVTWFAATEDARPVVVFAVGIRPDGGLEGCEFYVEPSRAGLRAAYAVLALFRMLIDGGTFPYGIVSTYAKNKPMHRRLREVFGVDGPCSMTFGYSREN
jgi:hypothetical protein